MKIKTLNLKSYGKFENKKIEFSDGLNVICGANGSGKSTIATALKTFLYKDLKGEGKYKKNYIPLGEKQGAYDVTFETDSGELYETVVTAGLTAAKTVHKTTNLSDNKEVATGIEIGEYFLGTKEDMFDSVCFIKEPSDFEKVSQNDKSVSEYLSKNSGKERSSVDISEAIESLTKEKYAFARQTASGYIYPKDSELSEVKEALLSVERISLEETELKNEESLLIKSLEGKKEKLKDLSVLLKKHEKYNEYEKYLKAKTAIDKKAELEKALKETEIEKCELSEEEIQKVKMSESVSAKSLPYLICGIILAAVFAVPGFFIPAFFIGTAISFFTFLAVFLLKKKKESNTRRDILLEKQLILNSVQCKTLDEYYFKNACYHKALAEKESLEKQLENILQFLPCEELIEVEAEDAPEGNYEDIKKEIISINEEITTLGVKISVILERRKNLYNNLPPYNELKERKEELEEELEKLREEERITLAALNIFKLTSERYKTAYLPSVSKRAEEILLAVEKNADKLSVDEKFTPSLRENDEVHLKDKDHLSSGISDSVYFAIRLAVMEYTFKDKENPILILDDPFVRMDDERMEAWIKYLHKDFPCQTIFFTAGKRIFNLGLEKDTTFAL